MELDTMRVGWDVASWNFVVMCIVSAIVYLMGGLDAVAALAAQRTMAQANVDSRIR